jgi:hypothetical protein
MGKRLLLKRKKSENDEKIEIGFFDENCRKITNLIKFDRDNFILSKINVFLEKKI